jgi:hypothetical protein
MKEKEFWFHWQNLNEDRFGRKKSPLKYGRCWWHFKNNKCIGLEWNFGKPHFHIGVDYGGFRDSEITLMFCIPFMNLYLSFENIFKRLKKTNYDRHTGIAVFDWKIWISIGNDETGWEDNRRQWWRHIIISPADLVLGSTKYSKVDLEKVKVDISMVEGSYPAEITLTECTWKRKRSPFKQVIKRAEVEMGKPIPIPGKGENSWDCGEDALYSITLPNKDTIQAAIAGTVESCLRDRFKYGGYGWKPKEVH